LQAVEKRHIAEKIFIGLLCAVALVMPFHKVLPSPLLTLAALVAVFSGNYAARWKRLKQNRSILIFAALYFVFIFAWLISENKEEATRDLQVKLTILLIPLVLGWFIEMRKNEVVLILRCFVFSCIAFSLFALAKAGYDLTTTGANHFYYKDLVAFTFIHPSYIAMYQVFAVGLLFFKLFQVWKQMRLVMKFIHIAAILLLLLFIFLLASKMAILSLFVLLPFIFYLFLQPVFGRMKTILLLCGMVAVGLVIIMSLPKTRERFMMLFTYNQVDYANSTDSRQEIWKSAMQISGRNLFTGVGSGDAEEVLIKQYATNGFQKGVDEKYNAHNQYIQVLVETGLPGLIIFLLVLGYAFRLAIRHKNDIYLSFLLVFVINIFTESMFKTQSGVVFFAFFNTLLGLHPTLFSRALTKP